MTRPAFAVGCAVAAVLLCAAACGTTKAAGPAAAGHPSAVARSASAPDAGTCPTRRAWATAISAAGHIAWQVSLPTAAQQQGVVLQPLVIGGVAVFAEENAVYGIRVSDGRQLWRRVFSKNIAAESGAVYGLWRSGGRVVVLTGQVSADARLTALTASTGVVGWTLPLPSELLGAQAQASGGTLAVLRPDGVLESVDLATGTVLWARHVGTSAGPAAVGPVIAAGGRALAVGYAGQGGGRVLWSTPLPGGADGLNLAPLSLAGGQAIAITSVQGTGFPTSTRLTVRRLGTGRPLASVTLPDMVLAPLTVTGTSVLAQSDSPACATVASGAVAASGAARG